MKIRSWILLTIILLSNVSLFVSLDNQVMMKESNVQNSLPSIPSQTSFFVNQSDIALLDSSYILSWENENISLRNLRTGKIIDTTHCSRASSFFGNSDYDNPFSLNKTRELITCGNTILEWNNSGFTHRFNGTFFMGAALFTTQQFQHHQVRAVGITS